MGNTVAAIGCTWLDRQSRVLAIRARPDQGKADNLSLHLRAAASGGAQLLARYAPAELL